jgi:uncharacterized protein YpuA (DUF1002 family)
LTFFCPVDFGLLYELKSFKRHITTLTCIAVLLTEVIEKYRNRIRELEPDIEEIEKQEREEKALRITENQINRVQNKLQNEEDETLRPKRTWFQSKQERLQELGKLSYSCS